MSLGLYLEADIQNIASAIRRKNGLSETYTVSEMASAIEAIPIGTGIYQSKNVSPSITSVTVTPDLGYDALNQVIVNSAPLSTISINPSTISQTVSTPTGYYGMDTVTVNSAPLDAKTVDVLTTSQTITPDAGYYGLSQVVVRSAVLDSLIVPTNVFASSAIYIASGLGWSMVTIKPIDSTSTIVIDDNRTYDVRPYATAIVSVSHSQPTGIITISSNGTYNVTNYSGATVSVSGTIPVISALNITPTESIQTFNSNDVDGYKPITVAAIDSEYVGSDIDRRDSSDLVANGNSVRVPAGYYEDAAYKAVAGGWAGVPTAIKGEVVDHTISITPTVSNITGYIAGGTKTGTAITVSVSELVSGTRSITANGNNIDVTNYASVDVAITSDINNQNKTVTPTENEQSINADGGYSGLGTVTVEAIDSDYVGSGVARQTATDVTINTNTGMINIPAGYYSTRSSKQLATQSAVTITPTESAQTAVAANKYTLGAITVAAIPSNYIGSEIIQRDETDLTASGATVTVPAGYYAEQETKSITSGTAGTPTATKGAVSNHAVTVTPSVTNTSGYITGGTKTGTGITVSASELVSGTKSISSNGTGIDVTNYASVDVTIPSDINNQNKSVAPTELEQEITADDGYSGLGTVTIASAPLSIATTAPSNTTITISTPAGYYGLRNVTINSAPLSVRSFTPLSRSAEYPIPQGYYGFGRVTISAASLSTRTVDPSTASVIVNTPTNYFGLETVTVNSAPLSTSAITPTTATQTINTPTGYYGLSTVTVNAIPSNYIVPTGTITLSSNGTFDVNNYASATINVAGGEYYSLYKSLALHQLVSSGAADVSTWCNSLSSITRQLFAGANLSGTFTFANCTKIATSAFKDASISGNLIFPSCTTVSSSAFLHCTQLNYVELPLCTKISADTFYNCPNLTSVSIPLCSSILTEAFHFCSNLSAINAPSCKSVGASAFAACTSLVSVSLPECTSLGSYAFAGCNSLVNLSLSKVTAIPSFGFYTCHALQSASFAVRTTIGQEAFYWCYSLTKISIPKVTTINAYAFRSCTSLQTISLPAVTSIAAQAFANCTALKSVYILTSTIPTAGANIFRNTPMVDSSYTGTFGKIYVKSSLLASFKTANYWSQYSARMVGQS